MSLLTFQRSAPAQLNRCQREREERRLTTVMVTMATDMVITTETMDMVIAMEITMALAMVSMATESRGAGRGVRHLAGTWVNRGTSTVLSRWIWFMANSKQASRPCTWVSWVTNDDPKKLTVLQ